MILKAYYNIQEDDKIRLLIKQVASDVDPNGEKVSEAMQFKIDINEILSSQEKALYKVEEVLLNFDYLEGQIEKLIHLKDNDEKYKVLNLDESEDHKEYE